MQLFSLASLALLGSTFANAVAAHAYAEGGLVSGEKYTIYKGTSEKFDPAPGDSVIHLAEPDAVIKVVADDGSEETVQWSNKTGQNKSSQKNWISYSA